MNLIDTHCHIHSADYPLDSEAVLKRAQAAGVNRVICIGTSLEDSRQAAEFASAHDGVYATVGIHPHEAAATLPQHTFSEPVLLERRANGDDQEAESPPALAGMEVLLGSDRLDQAVGEEKVVQGKVAKFNKSNVVAIGEIGLDYHYKPYDRAAQIELFEQQLQLALNLDLPVVFHVREAFDDFWPVVDNFAGIRGVLHSFSDNLANLQQGLRRDFYIGVNGIVTYKKTPEQAEAFANIPLEKLLLETDSPYLTPSSLRGTMNEPTHVGLVFEWAAKHFANMSPEEVANTTTKNAEELFNLNERERFSDISGASRTRGPDVRSAQR
ncbi:MAG: TatD family hydrolase [Candidatus Nomurabacteria bacterium]|jgi:TatD DNase family protein|nr:TatD family hydrolase [Candidatus Nomurabacteria bacterium]